MNWAWSTVHEQYSIMLESLAIVDNEIANNLTANPWDASIVCDCITIDFQRGVRPFKYTAGAERSERFWRPSIFCETISLGFLVKDWWVQLPNRQHSNEISLQNLSQTFRNVERIKVSLWKSRFSTKCCVQNLWWKAPKKPILTPFRPHTALNRSAKPNNTEIFSGE